MNTTILKALVATLHTSLTPDEQMYVVTALTARYYMSETGVALGVRSLADAQRTHDDAAGGLVALAMRGQR